MNADAESCCQRWKPHHRLRSEATANERVPRADASGEATCVGQQLRRHRCSCLLVGETRTAKSDTSSSSLMLAGLTPACPSLRRMLLLAWMSSTSLRLSHSILALSRSQSIQSDGDKGFTNSDALLEKAHVQQKGLISFIMFYSICN